MPCPPTATTTTFSRQLDISVYSNLLAIFYHCLYYLASIVAVAVCRQHIERRYNNNISVYVCRCAIVHACMCVCLVNDFINFNVKTETKWMICCEEIPTFYRHARFLLRLQILPRQLPHLPHT